MRNPDYSPVTVVSNNEPFGDDGNEAKPIQFAKTAVGATGRSPLQCIVPGFTGRLQVRRAVSSTHDHPTGAIAIRF